MMQLHYRGLSEIRGTKETGLIVLTDLLDTRQLVVVCDMQTASQFRIRTTPGLDNMRLLPEVLLKVLQQDSTASYNITIEDIQDGVYQTVVVNEQSGEKYKIRASDGLLIAHIGDWPIYISSELFARQSVPFLPKSSSLGLPINAISEEMLKDALEKAIEQENYELANHISQELKKRKSKKE